MIEHPTVAESCWWQAATLQERLITLRKQTHERPAIDLGPAQARLRQWRAKPPLDKDENYQQWLSLIGCQESELLQLLGEPIEAVQARCPLPADFLDFIHALNEPDSETDWPFSAETMARQPGSDFLFALTPLIHQVRRHLRAEVAALQQRYTPLPFDPTTIESIVFSQIPNVSLMLDRIMVVELHSAGHKDLLFGETPQARYQHFIGRLRQPEIRREFWQRRPVLARQLVTFIHNWMDNRLEFLSRLCQDWPSIRTLFSPEQQPGPLVSMQAELGDPHRSGRTVIKAQFQSGFQLIYKPKPLAVDVHFQEMLAWLNERQAEPPMPILKVLDLGHYGWIEFVGHEACPTQAGLSRFYQRQGAYLALLHLLHGQDFHAYNLIAVGENPVLIDLEGLLHSRWPRSYNAPPSWTGGMNYLYHSVMAIGLLPQPALGYGLPLGIDISGLTGGGQQMSRMSYWKDPGTDEMRVDYEERPVFGKNQNIPHWQGQAALPRDYLEEIVEGFTRMYDLLAAHRRELLAENGPLMRFAQDPVRVILRDTSLYRRFMKDSYHPLLKQDGLERERFYARLGIGMYEYQPALLATLSAEQHDMMQGDIPVFTTRPDSRDLWSGTNERIRGVLEEPTLNKVIQRLLAMGKSDYARQVWLIRASFAAYHMNDETAARDYQVEEGVTAVSPQRLQEAARAVGDRLELLAWQDEAAVSWIGVEPHEGEIWRLAPLDVDLYGGLAGIILFLAYLGRVTEECRYTRLSQAVFQTLQHDLASIEPDSKPIGGYEGWGSLIYLLTHLAVLWNRPELLDEAEELVAFLPPLIEADTNYDVMSGAAGCLVSLLLLNKVRPSQAALAAARLCGDHLVAAAQPQPVGVGWPRPDESPPLTGFSHGAAGIAWALLELDAVVTGGCFRTTAQRAMAYERSQFSVKADNWFDLRPSPKAAPQEEGRFMTAWCHGAPGIGLARLRSLSLLGEDSAVEAEIETALQTTRRRGFGQNHSLCHGDLGNLELFLQAGQDGGNGRWAKEITHLSGTILRSIEQHGWLCGNTLAAETPGLMTGLAGIGYGLLRLSAPTQVPAVLLLDPPIG